MILNIYFKNLHIINTDVIPDGPVIITGPPRVFRAMASECAGFSSPFVYCVEHLSLAGSQSNAFIYQSLHPPPFITSPSQWIAGNHQNQFVDGVLQMCSCPRKMHTLMAKKSLDRPVIGHFGSGKADAGLACLCLCLRVGSGLLWHPRIESGVCFWWEC